MRKSQSWLSATKIACGQRQKPDAPEPQIHKGPYAISDLNDDHLVVWDLIVYLSLLGIGQPLGLIDYDPRSYWSGLVRGLKPNQTKQTTHLDWPAANNTHHHLTTKPQISHHQDAYQPQRLPIPLTRPLFLQEARINHSIISENEKSRKTTKTKNYKKRWKEEKAQKNDKKILQKKKMLF